MCLDATSGALRRSHGLSEGHKAHAPRPTKRTRHRRCRYISTAKSRLIGKLTGQIDWKPTKAPNQAGPLSHVRQALRNVHLQRKVVHCFGPLPDTCTCASSVAGTEHPFAAKRRKGSTRPHGLRCAQAWLYHRAQQLNCRPPAHLAYFACIPRSCSFLARCLFSPICPCFHISTLVTYVHSHSLASEARSAPADTPSNSTSEELPRRPCRRLRATPSLI